MKTRILLAVAIAVLALPAMAETPNGNLRVMFSSANPTGSFSGNFDIGGGVIVPGEIEADSTFAFGLVYEVRIGDRWGLESGVYFADFDFEIQSSGLTIDFGSSLAIPLIMGADFHVFSNERIDLYVGPQVGYTFWGNLSTPVGMATIDGDFGFGAVAGLDFRPGKSGWTLNLATRYLSAALSDASAEIDVDPLLLEFGVGYRF
jgi:outer membrane protein W